MANPIFPCIFVGVMEKYRELCNRLTGLYEAGEAKSIVRMVLDVRFGFSLTDVLCGRVEELSANEKEELEKMMCRLEQGCPVQYVLGETSFFGHTFHVEPGVLIPRPETEDLVGWVASSEGAGATNGISILDIGTGSGCIACSLALVFPDAAVTAWDISDDALRIARQNAEMLHADVRFVRQDALMPPEDVGQWDVIVSNPPYICRQEAQTMERNVLDYEPHTALFVSDDDPLLFYRSIARYAQKALKPGGKLFFEINPLYCRQLENMLTEMGYFAVTLREDQSGRQRFIKATTHED